MSLVRCCECRRKVSDAASSCPNCGAPVAMTLTKMKREQGIAAKLLLGCVSVPIVGLGLILVMAAFLPSQPKPEDGSRPVFIPPQREVAKPRERHANELDPALVLEALRVSGFDLGTWKQSRLDPAEWIASLNGAAIEIGVAGENGLPTNVMVYAYGRRDAIAEVVIKLNVNRPDMRVGGVDLWRSKASKLAEIWGETLPNEIVESAISGVQNRGSQQLSRIRVEVERRVDRIESIRLSVKPLTH